MEEKKVSVVVPIYNVENYLDRCVDTIVCQTYKNLEIILVDDGSTDNSGKLCDAWSEKDERVRVVHKKNGGLSSARNAGMEHATGDCIMFEDSDDWLEKELIEKCVKRMDTDESDLVIFGYRKVDEEENSQGEFTFGNETFSKEELTEQLYDRILEMSFGYAWNKLYRMEVLVQSGLKNDSSIIDREDLVFNMQLLKYLKRISYMDYVGYNYLQRSTSLLHNSNLARLKNIGPFCERMYHIDLQNEVSQKKVYSMNVLHYLSDCIIKNVLWNKELNRKQKYDWMKKILEDCPYIDKIEDDPNNPAHLKMLYKTIMTGKPKYFYRYVWLSDIKKKIMGR